jgi:hypothetical protein
MACRWRQDSGVIAHTFYGCFILDQNIVGKVVDESKLSEGR